jgi:signal transduction histidine kinase/predicted hydrocarbon binding protein
MPDDPGAPPPASTASPERLRELSGRVRELELENARLRRGIFEPSRPHVVRAPAAVQPLFERAAVEMRELFSRIEIDPARALIGIDDERYVLVRASAFSIDLLDTLVQLYADRGEREALAIARGFLFDIAHTIGLHDARRIHDKLGGRDAVEKLTTGPVHFAYTGWSFVSIQEGSELVADERFCLIYEHPYSFEAASFLREGRTSDGPVCIMGAGYSSGWCEASFGVELTALEVHCRACGDAACTFVMAPPDKVALQARRHFGVDRERYAQKGCDVPTYFERKRAEEEVRRSLVQLKEAQDELVRKERLATVGLLVSGVAHEVNTPLGVAVTASSVIREELQTLRGKFESNALNKRDLRKFLERAGEAEELVNTNLARAAEQITMFKRVSFDHVNEEPRAVALDVYVAELVESLAPIIRKGPLAVRLTSSGQLERKTHPGAVAQILTNFLTNSALHARRDDGQPVGVQIALDGGADQVVLSYRDDGRGMDPSTQQRAFEPFFTTSRGSGGTGLGLHIVRSLVCDVLGGRIELSSAPGEGVLFRVTFPALRCAEPLTPGA